MDAKSIISRLRNTQYPASTKIGIKYELRQLPYQERQSILDQLRIEKTRSDNSDLQDVIDDIIQEFSPNK